MSQPQFVVFATPAFDHNVTLAYFKAAMETDWLLRDNGIDRGYKQFGGDPYLAKVRNLLVASCLKEYPQMTDLFFIDADVGYPAEAVLRLLQHPGDIVAGIYPKKNDVPEFPCQLQLVDGKLIEKDGWYKAIHVPTGFLRIKRHVLEQMSAISPRYRDGTGGGHVCANLFEMGYCGDDAEKHPEGFGDWWGEDYAFCQRWHRMGGEIWVYPDIEFTHRGAKSWGASFLPSVRAFENGQAKIVDLNKKDSAA